MDTFGQMEAEWRDQQSGARDQKYDEELEDPEGFGLDDAATGADDKPGAAADALQDHLQMPRRSA